MKCFGFLMKCLCMHVSPLHVWGSALDDPTPYVCQRIIQEGVY